MLNLDQVAAYLDPLLESDRFTDDPNGIYRPSSCPIQRLGLALEPNQELAGWVARLNLDALLLHRPWHLAIDELPENLGVLAYHLSLDEHLTIGFNPTLAAKLNLTELEVLGTKSDRPIGMIGNLPVQPLAQISQALRCLFGGLEQQMGDDRPISCVAVVGAMTDRWVQEAHDRGAQLYLTGQFRKVAAAAVEETGLAVVSIGHHRSELWGLRILGQLLTQQWEGLEVYCFPDRSPLS